MFLCAGVSGHCLDPHIHLQPTHPPPHQTMSQHSNLAGDGAVRYPMSTQCPYGPSHMWCAPGNAPGYSGQQVIGPSYGAPYQSSVSGVGPYGSQNAPPYGDVSGQPQGGPPHSSGAGVPSGLAPCAGEITKRCTHVHVC